MERLQAPDNVTEGKVVPEGTLGFSVRASGFRVLPKWDSSGVLRRESKHWNGPKKTIP